MKKTFIILSLLFFAFSLRGSADILTAIPSADDQGGMIMPMIGISGNSLTLMFMPPMEAPTLGDLEFWSPGDEFDPSAAWYSLLNPASSGQGALFNSQYGFMWNGIMPGGKALGIRLLSWSSSGMQSWNYVNSQNRFDEVFTNAGDQALWNGNMWHSYFTLPNDAAPGVYTASFEIFVADATFTGGTGWVDYTPGARSAMQDMGYTTVVVDFSWNVVPEPSTCLLMICAVVMGMLLLARRTAE